MSREIKLGNKWAGDDHPTYIIAEIGINHDGDLSKALELVRAAALAGADACKFQKRNPDISTPEDQKDKPREWKGVDMTYLEYKFDIEFGLAEYTSIDNYAKHHRIDWTASVWDIDSLKFMGELVRQEHGIPFIKIPSAHLTNRELVYQARSMTGVPLVMSTGMSTKEEIQGAVNSLSLSSSSNLPWALMHCTSTYPVKNEEINLEMIRTLRDEYPDTVIGYSNHSPSILSPALAVTYGADIIEAHITSDRSAAGTDHSASIEPHGLAHMVRYIRAAEAAAGDGVKRIYPGELSMREKLRGS